MSARRKPLRFCLIGAALTAIAFGSAVAAHGGAPKKGESRQAAFLTVKRCCFRVEMKVQGTISVNFGTDANAYWSGRRDYTWSATTIGTYQYENTRRPRRADPELTLVGQAKRKFGSSEVGDIASNFRSPDPPNRQAGEPSVSRCNERVTSGGKWVSVGSGVGQVVQLARRGKRVVMEIHLPGPPFRQPGAVFDGDCDVFVDSHDGTGSSEPDGLPLKDFEGLKPPSPLNGLRAPSRRKLKKKPQFGTTYPTFRVNHPPERDPRNARYHTTEGRNTLEVKFTYVKK